MSESEQTDRGSIPLGRWEVITGVWHPNNRLTLSSAQQHLHNMQHGFSCVHYLSPATCIQCRTPPLNAAIDTPIIFSHVQAMIVAAVLCPDCQTTLAATVAPEPGLECAGCSARFKFPTITLERFPSEDYTSPDPNG